MKSCSQLHAEPLQRFEVGARFKLEGVTRPSATASRQIPSQLPGRQLAGQPEPQSQRSSARCRASAARTPSASAKSCADSCTASCRDLPEPAATVLWDAGTPLDSGYDSEKRAPFNRALNVFDKDVRR